jgi:hypothetical protein
MDDDGLFDDEVFLDQHPHLMFAAVPTALTHNVSHPDITKDEDENEDLPTQPLKDEDGNEDLPTQPLKDEDIIFQMSQTDEPSNGMHTVSDAAALDARELDEQASYPVNSVVTVEGLLRTNRTTGNDWTHLMTWPDQVRSSITDATDAGLLYRNMSSYTSVGMGVMERRLSSITRMSIRILLNNVISPTESIETHLVGQIGNSIQNILSHQLVKSVPSALRRFCLVLRPDDVACHPQEYIFHWPCIAVSSAEFHKKWCDELLTTMAMPSVRSIIPRNTASYYPMYGCCATASEPRMKLRWIVDGDGGVRSDWMAWMQDPRNRLHKELCIGHGSRFPEHPNKDVVLRLLPLICSINPMGTGASLLHRETTDLGETGDTGVQSEFAPILAALERSINALSPERIASVKLSNEVGEMIYAACCGAASGYRMWIRWLRESRDALSVQCELELLSQWASFAQHPGGLDGLLRLKCLVRRDNTRAVWEEFLQHEREADHRDRQSNNPISAAMGSLTHMDLAKFVWHQLNETVQCTSTAGRGLWYVYKQRIRNAIL